MCVCVCAANNAKTIASTTQRIAILMANTLEPNGAATFSQLIYSGGNAHTVAFACNMTACTSTFLLGRAHRQSLCVPIRGACIFGPTCGYFRFLVERRRCSPASCLAALRCKDAKVWGETAVYLPFCTYVVFTCALRGIGFASFCVAHITRFRFQSFLDGVFCEFLTCSATETKTERGTRWLIHIQKRYWARTMISDLLAK